MKRRRAFSLVEVLVTMALLAALTVVAVTSVRGNNGKGRAKLAADALGAIFKSAGARARAQGFPVAVALPTNDGSRGASQGCFILEGESNPRVTRVHRLDVDFPDTVIAGGSYDGPTWQPAASGHDNIASPVDVNAWAGAWSSNHIYLFLPTGQCISNHSAAAGTYRVTVAASLQGTAGNPDAQTVTRAYLPYTVSIAPSGSVDVVPGLPGGSSSLTATSAFGSVPTATLPVLSTAANRVPTLADPYYNVAPAATASGLTELKVRPGALLSLEAYCKDPDGDALFARWSASGATDSGKFAEPGRTRMRWDAARERWVTRTTWRAPLTIPTGVLTLDCVMDDDRGGQISLQGSVSSAPAPSKPLTPLSLKVAPVPRLAWANEAGFASGEVWVCNLQGGEETQLVSGEKQGEVWHSTEMEWSPNNDAVIWCRQNGYGWADVQGSKARPFYSGSQPQRGLCADMKGRGIYVLEANYAAKNHQIVHVGVKPDGSADSTVLHSFGAWTSSDEKPYYDCIYMDPDGAFALAYDEYSTWHALIFANGTQPYKAQTLNLGTGQAGVSIQGVQWIQGTTGEIKTTRLVYDPATHSVSNATTVTHAIPGFTNSWWSDVGLSRSGRYLVDHNLRVVDLVDHKTWTVPRKESSGYVYVARIAD
jgi:prepilin-type N-terminal cleavage/methylation domain-containing protein